MWLIPKLILPSVEGTVDGVGVSVVQELDVEGLPRLSLENADYKVLSVIRGTVIGYESRMVGEYFEVWRIWRCALTDVVVSGCPLVEKFNRLDFANREALRRRGLLIENLELGLSSYLV